MLSGSPAGDAETQLKIPISRKLIVEMAEMNVGWGPPPIGS